MPNRTQDNEDDKRDMTAESKIWGNDRRDYPEAQRNQAEKYKYSVPDQTQGNKNDKNQTGREKQGKDRCNYP